MVKVITYGTYDLLHYGHVRLLERAKALGDHLIVGVTADDFDKVRGKINVRQSLMERVEGVRSTGLADEIIVEEYEGQKIDDIRRLGVDIFTVGSDWAGKFDYLNEYCKVVYLPRTEGISSSDLRASAARLRLGIAGDGPIGLKFARECGFVNGIDVAGVYASDPDAYKRSLASDATYASGYEELLDRVDAVYLNTHPSLHFDQVRLALEHRRHVLCESPVALRHDQAAGLFDLADRNGCVLMDSIKTAYATAYARMLLLIKGGRIGDVAAVNVTCTSLHDLMTSPDEPLDRKWNSMCAWGPTAMLPIFQIFGTKYADCRIVSKYLDRALSFDAFTDIRFVYPDGVANLQIGKGVKSEGCLTVMGTTGYVYVPAPWWKPDYFEIRYEDANRNRRYFYQLDGEGIRYELVEFANSIRRRCSTSLIDRDITLSMIDVIEKFYGSSVISIK